MKPSELAISFKAAFKRKEPLMVVGPPGIGKTDIVESVAKKLGYKLIVMYPAIAEPVDFRGMPTYDRKSKIASFVPFDDLLELINATEPTVCFMDDFGQANQSVQAACMHLFLSRRIGAHKISDHITFVICTNDVMHHAGVTGIIEPVKSRMLSIIHLIPDLDDWVNWAIKNNLRPEVIGFMRLRGNKFLSKFKPTTSLMNTPSPRGTANVSRILDLGMTSAIEAELIEGAVGKAYAVEFKGFQILFENLASPEEILKDPKGVNVPYDNPSILFAYCSALSHIAAPDKMDAIVAFAKRLPIEYQIKLLEYDCKSASEKNHETSAYIDWAIENQAVQKHQAA